MSVVALVPARSGSKRVPGKNVRLLAGHPLVAYTIASAQESGVFDTIVVSTDAEDVADIARHYGASAPFLRPARMAADTSPDIDWVTHAIEELRSGGVRVDVFAILRPTSPLRLPSTIRRAWDAFEADHDADSLRAVELCSEHPGKMWLVDGDRMRPLLDDGGADPPWHSTPYQSLPTVHVQNASLELARVRTIDQLGSIAGRVIRPFVTLGYEGYDVNLPQDWLLLERLVETGAVELPAIGVSPYEGGVG